MNLIRAGIWVVFSFFFVREIVYLTNIVPVLYFIAHSYPLDDKWSVLMGIAPYVLFDLPLFFMELFFLCAPKTFFIKVRKPILVAAICSPAVGVIFEIALSQNGHTIDYVLIFLALTLSILVWSVFKSANTADAHRIA